MAKKKKSLTGLILSAVAIVLGLVSVLLIFAPAAAIKDTDTSYTGLNLAFGLKKSTGLGDAVIFKFSFMNLLPYLLLIAGLVFSVLALLGKLGKIAPIVAAACYLVAGVFLFCAVSFCVLGDGLKSLSDWGSALSGKGAKDALALGAGAIVSGVFSILAAISSAAALVIKK